MDFYAFSENIKCVHDSRLLGRWIFLLVKKHFKLLLELWTYTAFQLLCN